MGFGLRCERHIFGVFFPIPNIDHAFFVGIHTDGGNFFRPAQACDQKDLSERHRSRHHPLPGFLVSDGRTGLYDTFEERVPYRLQCRVGAVHRRTVFQKESDGPGHRGRAVVDRRHRRHFPDRLPQRKLRGYADAGFALLFALQIIFTNRFVLGENIYALTTIQMGTATLLGVLVSLARGEFLLPAAAEGYFSIIYLGTVSTMLGFLIQTASQQFTKETETAIILSLEAVFGMVASALFLKEAITLRMLIGAALILAGVLIVELKPKRTLTGRQSITDVQD